MIDPNGTGNISDVIIDGVATATAMKWSGGSGSLVLVLLGKRLYIQF